MKKILAFVLIALLAVTSVFATGTTETTATAPAAGAAEGGKIYDGVEITMWSMWNAAEPQGQAIIDAAAQFEEETGCHVNIEFRGRDIKTIINTSLQGGEDIDIFEEAYDRIYLQYAPYCYDMTEMAEAAGYADFSYPLFNKMTTDATGGKLVSVAEQPNVGGIFYDKAKFEAAGITETPETWDEFLAVCQQLVDAGFQPLALDSTYADFTFGYHLNRYVDEDSTRALSLNGGWSQNPGVIAAAEDIIDFVNRGYLAEGAPDEYPAGQNKIGFENVAMVVCADYVTSEVPVEDGGNGATGSYAGANSLAITSYTENPQAAFDFVMMLVSGDVDQKRADSVPQIPADPRNNCISLDGAVETLMSADSVLSWTMGLNANTDLTAMIKEVVIQLYEGRFATGEAFAAALDALY